MNKVIRVPTSKIGEVRQELLENQDYKCAICGIDLKNDDNTNRHTDHNHVTGMIRGICCRACNTTEGLMLHKFKRSGHVAQGTDYIEWLEKHLTYLKNATTNYEHPAHTTLKHKKFKNLNKTEQLQELKTLGVIPEGKVTKKDLLKMYKKALKG